MRLTNNLKLQFLMMHEHRCSLNDIENMIVWERNIYLDLLKAYVEEQNMKRNFRQ